MCSALARTSLREEEREALTALADALQRELGSQLQGLWLFGSAARGEAERPDSDIDLMVVVKGGRSAHWRLVWELIEEIGPRYGADPIRFSPHVVDPAWVEGRRQIESFFIEEVDRDKVVLAGSG